MRLKRFRKRPLSRAMPTRPTEGKVRAWSPYLIGGAFALAGLSQARVQVFGREDILDLGEKSGRYLIRSVDPARRGPILSSDGGPLAQNEDSCEFGLIFDKLPDSDAFFMELSAACGVPAAEMRRLKDSGQKTMFWPEALSREQMRAVQAVRTNWRADGISVGPSRKRGFSLGEAAAGLIGYFRNGEPQAGLELSQNKTLSGTNGVTIGVTDRTGAFLPMRLDSRSKARQDGESLTLTIDSSMQLAAANAIRQAVESNHADRGVAIAMDPKTGDILAMANWPSLDPDRVGEPVGKQKVMTDLNPNYMIALEPGSTFKVLTLGLGLDAGVVTPGETFYCRGALDPISGYSVKCDKHHGTRAHGLLHPVDAISRSCNVCAATWALRVGYERYTRFLDESGLMEKSDIGVPLEANGHYKRDEYAKRLQLATMGFGQSMTCTPLGLMSAFSSLANDGVRMKPRLIKAIGDRQQPIEEAGRLFTSKTSKTVLGFMEAVIDSNRGTGKTLRIPGFRLGGKTGTAQKIGKGSTGYVSNFVGMVPANDPKVVILVMVDHPKGNKYYGADVAGPVFTDMARAAIRRYGIQPSARPTGPTLAESSKTAADEPKPGQSQRQP